MPVLAMSAWPEQMFSLLVALSKPESRSVCVAGRSARKATVRDVRHLGSQQLAVPAVVNGWLSCLGDPDEVLVQRRRNRRNRVVHRDSECTAQHDWSVRQVELLLPGSISIARVIIESWAACR